MSKRLNELIQRKKNQNDKLLSVFITAGFPSKAETEDIVLALDEAGVDFVELGIPFSDPIADGPVIQAASDKALKNGINMEEVFHIVENIRRHSNIPIILMGYLNPIFKFGIDSAIERSHASGVDAWIIPDWPLEESSDNVPKLRENDIDLIHLIAPNTPEYRIKKIDQNSTSFIYCVAYTGVTGKNNRPTPQTIDFFSKLNDLLTHPLMIGFGIKNHQDYLTYTQFADGVIIGSHFIRLIDRTTPDQYHSAIMEFVRNIRGV